MSRSLLESVLGWSMDDTANLFLAYMRPLHRRLHLVARRYTGNDHDARDLVQETLLRAFRGFAPCEEQIYRRAWAFVIMRNVALDWQRAADRRITLRVGADAELTTFAAPDNTEPFAPFPAMDEARFREFLDDKLAAALDALDPAFREVIVLSVVGDMSYRSIAEVLDCPVGTVMSRMARARRALRERLAEFARSRGWPVEQRA